MTILCRTSRYPELTPNKEYFAEFSSIEPGFFEIITDHGFMGDYPVEDFDILWENIGKGAERA